MINVSLGFLEISAHGIFHKHFRMIHILQRPKRKRNISEGR